MDLSYPLGKYEHKSSLTPAERETAIAQIAAAPKCLRDAVAGLSHQQFDTPYRPGGWTVRQVVHHVPDSHLNSYVRFKLALTENEPTIRPYDEALWAKLQDSRDTPVEVSLSLLESLHHRWEVLLRSLGPEDFSRRLRGKRRWRAEVVIARDDHEVRALVDDFEASLGAFGAIRLGVYGHDLDLAPKKTTGLVDLVDPDHRGILRRLVIGLHEPRACRRKANDDVGSVSGDRRAQKGARYRKYFQSCPNSHSTLPILNPVFHFSANPQPETYPSRAFGIRSSASFAS